MASEWFTAHEKSTDSCFWLGREMWLLKMLQLRMVANEFFILEL